MTPMQQPKDRRRARAVALEHAGAGTTVLPAETPRRRVAERVGEMLDHATADELTLLESVTHPGGSDGLDPRLWGEAPSTAESVAGAFANLRLQFESRRTIEASSLTRAQAAELLGVSAQAVTAALEDGRLVGLKRGRQWFIPVWQFDAEAERGVLEGIDELAAVFPGGPISLSTWMTTASPDLGGATPRDLLARGQREPVVGLARALTASGW
jgi:hypothetical protein